jgi:hypothetical protein
MTNFNAEAEGVTPDDIVERLLDVVSERADESAADRVFKKAE